MKVTVTKALVYNDVFGNEHRIEADTQVNAFTLPHDASLLTVDGESINMPAGKTLIVHNGYFIEAESRFIKTVD